MPIVYVLVSGSDRKEIGQTREEFDWAISYAAQETASAYAEYSRACDAGVSGVKFLKRREQCEETERQLRKLYKTLFK